MRHVCRFWGVKACVLLCLCGFGAGASAQFDKSVWPSSQATPLLDVVDLKGQRWTSAELRGRVVVLNFWASWCAPCVEELPSLQALHLAGAGAPIVLGINVKESAATVKPFLKRMQIDFPVALDPQGAMARQWGVRVYPSTILLAPDGQARWRVVGDLNWSGVMAQGWVRELTSPKRSAIKTP